MIIEIRGTGTHNKGAELMLIAIVQELSRGRSDVQFAVDPQFGPYAARAKYGLLTKVRAHKYGRSRIARQLMSESFRRTYGLVVESDIDAVIDASGFAFGDQWGPGPSEWLARESSKWRRRGVDSVLLPQAFGPFADARVRGAFREALESLRLVFARDRTSFAHIQDLGGPFDQVQVAPDFTNVVGGVFPEGITLPERFGCIVPNIRMLDKTESSDRDAYIGFLADCIRQCRQSDVEPVFLYHDRIRDEEVASMVQRELRCSQRVIEEGDPVVLKGILSRAHVVIGSRFHALVGALSSGVPAIGTSWSHKYQELFVEYGCADWLVTPSKYEAETELLFARLQDDAERTGLEEQLRERSAALRRDVDVMFGEVARALGV